MKEISESTSKGCECWYFSNRDETGWKIYQYKKTALLAWAAQKWVHNKNLAPEILSDVKKFNLVPSLIDTLICPVTNRTLFGKFCPLLKKRVYEFRDKEKANCSEHFNSNKPIIFYGFLTEKIKILGSDINVSKMFEYKQKLKCGLKEFNISYFDLNSENFGIKENKPVVIDLGTHFLRSCPEIIQTEIQNIASKHPLFETDK